MRFSPCHSIAGLLLVVLLGSPTAAGALAVADPRCEGLREASLIDTASPRFSWRLETSARAARQAAYRLRITDGATGPAAPTVIHDTGRVESDATQWIRAPGFAPQPRTTYAWQVQVWDDHGSVSPWSEPQAFGTGLLGTKWPADWIGDGRTLPRFETAPARHFRGGFTVEKAPVRARLYVSAFGLVELWINGQAVTADRFVPGWPDYRHRLFYVAYDVTPLIQAGENVWGALLGDGWYSGTILPLHQYGPEATFSAFLDLTGAEGEVTTITTDGAWRWTEDGPIRMNSIYHGESYDARRDSDRWSTAAGEEAWSWRAVSVRPARRVYQHYTARISPPVRRIETLKPIAVQEVAPGVFQYDLGQNLVGWVRLKVRAPAGQAITLRFAEMLEADGRLHTANLRDAQATARYVARGEGVEEWEPRFTFFGFRYVELSGLDRPLEDAIEAVVVHTDLPRTGTFTCSDPWLNQLYQNTLWGQKGNFLEIPTDCPQRDERLGWSGDTQVFTHTALYNLDAGRFYRQWLFALRDSYRDGAAGGFADTAPNTGHGHGSAGWAEAGVIVPWITWLHTGDRQLLVESLPSIQHFIETMANQSPDGIRLSPPAWGDWLAPGFALFQAPPRYELIATAYFAHAADLAAKIAELVDRPELAARNRSLHDQIRAAFQRRYFAPDGRMVDDVQTSYLLALGFDLVPPELREAVVAHLVRTFAEKDNHLATGFLGTPLIAPVLTQVGRADLAYTVLLQKSYPGWLFSVKNGATTVWERWDSWTPEHGFNPDGMNSFNHYAYGSVVGWFYDTIAGLRPLPEAPGWKHFRIAPVPGGGLTHAAAEVLTPHGRAASEWRLEADQLHLNVAIPPNTTAEIEVPADDAEAVRIDDAPLPAFGLAQDISRTRTGLRFTLPSGEYRLTIGPSVR